jgi:pyridoxal phosphate enzyme (YggS family)
MTSTLAGNHDEVYQRLRQACLRAGKAEGTVTLVAVTKFQDPLLIFEAARVGLKHFAESRVQEAQTKFQDPALRALGTWHLIGHLQSNKAKLAAELFDVVQSVDSVRLAEKLDEAAGALGKTLRVFAQVNISAEPQKHGLALERANEEIQQIARLPHLKLEGLMGMAAATEDPQDARPAFKALQQLRQNLSPTLGPLTLSMGMSHDFEVAIEEGSDMVRIGTDLFKGRPA